MRYIRRIVLAVFLISALSYAGLSYYHMKHDDTQAPVIKMDAEEITVKVTADESEMLEGLTAEDDRDGDITSQIIVESIGPFLSDNSRKITYAVCDSSNNIGTASRKLYYKGYHSPEFDITERLSFSTKESIDPSGFISASDMLDGDISNRLRLINQDIDFDWITHLEAGIYEMGYQVSNSAGDVSLLQVPVAVYDAEETYVTPQIFLKEQIVYLKKGDKKFNPYRYLDEVTLGNRTFDILEKSDFTEAEKGYRVRRFYGDHTNKPSNTDEIESLDYSDFYVDSTVDADTPGAYRVIYELTTTDGYTGYIGMSVIVRE